MPNTSLLPPVGTPAFVNSSARITCSSADSPAPPYSVGQLARGSRARRASGATPARSARASSPSSGRCPASPAGGARRGTPGPSRGRPRPRRCTSVCMGGTLPSGSQRADARRAAAPTSGPSAPRPAGTMRAPRRTRSAPPSSSACAAAKNALAEAEGDRAGDDGEPEVEQHARTPPPGRPASRPLGRSPAAPRPQDGRSRRRWPARTPRPRGSRGAARTGRPSGSTMTWPMWPALPACAVEQPAVERRSRHRRRSTRPCRCSCRRPARRPAIPRRGPGPWRRCRRHRQAGELGAADRSGKSRQPGMLSGDTDSPPGVIGPAAADGDGDPVLARRPSSTATSTARPATGRRPWRRRGGPGAGSRRQRRPARPPASSRRCRRRGSTARPDVGGRPVADHLAESRPAVRLGPLPFTSVTVVERAAPTFADLFDVIAGNIERVSRANRSRSSWRWSACWPRVTS